MDTRVEYAWEKLMVESTGAVMLEIERDASEKYLGDKIKEIVMGCNG